MLRLNPEDNLGIRYLRIVPARCRTDRDDDRPRVSNDNPYSEAGFKTIKYRPEMPERFGSIEHARAVMAPLLGWYNTAHYHTGLALLTPADVHHGRAPAIVATRQLVLDAALVRHPERFVNGRPIQKSPPPAVWINPPPMDQIVIADRITDRIAITDSDHGRRSDRGGRCSLNSRDRRLRIVGTHRNPSRRPRSIHYVAVAAPPLDLLECHVPRDAPQKASVGAQPIVRGSRTWLERTDEHLLNRRLELFPPLE